MSAPLPSSEPPSSEPEPRAGGGPAGSPPPAREAVAAAAHHLIVTAARRLGLPEGAPPPQRDDFTEARLLITALAGLVTAATPGLGPAAARPLREALRSLQLAFRTASAIPDRPGEGPGERWTGPVLPRSVPVEGSVDKPGEGPAGKPGEGLGDDAQRP